MPNDLDTDYLFRPSTPGSTSTPRSSTPSAHQAGRGTSAPSPTEIDPTTQLDTGLDSGLETEPKKGIELSLTQLIGGALAAMTAAALGSQIGLAGTVVGAAVASVIAGVGGALYTASIRRTRDTVRTVFRGRPDGSAHDQGTQAVPVWHDDDPARRGVPAAVGPIRTARPSAASTPTIAIRRVSRRGLPRRRLWRRVLVGAVASFVLAAAALTSIEVLSGHALSGESGTTIERVTQSQRSSAGQRTDQPAADESAEPTAAPTTEASTSGSAAPADPTTEPTAAPTATPTASPTAEPSGSTTPTTSGSASPSASGSPEATTAGS